MNTENANAAIEQNEWKDYLADFTSRHANRLARLEILGDEIGASEAAEHLPFVMASFEDKGSAAGGALITLGDGADQILHTVSGVKSITPQTGDDGSEAALEIVGAEEKAILIFE